MAEMGQVLRAKEFIGRRVIALENVRGIAKLLTSDDVDALLNCLAEDGRIQVVLTRKLPPLAAAKPPQERIWKGPK